MDLSEWVKSKRKELEMTQPDFARYTAVGLRFIRELEQGKQTLKVDKVNQVLEMFGYRLGPVKKDATSNG